jgi:hypothetical protein
MELSTSPEAVVTNVTNLCPDGWPHKRPEKKLNDPPTFSAALLRAAGMGAAAVCELKRLPLRMGALALG